MKAHPRRVDRSDGDRIFDLDGFSWTVPIPFYLNTKPTPKGENAVFVGWATKIVRTDAGLVATGIVTKHADQIRRGFFGRPFVTSAYLVPQDTEELPDGHHAIVNGIEITGPCRIIRRCRVAAVWIVAMGCDPKTTFTLHEGTANVLEGH